MTTQTVIDESDPTLRGGEAVDVQDPLDSLLSEYDEATSKPAEQKPNSDLEFLVSRMKEQDAKAAADVLQSDFNDVVSNITKGMEGYNVDSDAVSDFLHGEARRDPRIDNAFDNRHAKPAEWNSLVNGLTEKLKGKSSPSETQTDVNRQAVTQSVRSASTNKPTADEQVNTNGMTKAQLDQHFAKY